MKRKTKGRKEPNVILTVCAISKDPFYFVLKDWKPVGTSKVVQTRNEAYLSLEKKLTAETNEGQYQTKDKEQQ